MEACDVVVTEHEPLISRRIKKINMIKTVKGQTSVEVILILAVSLVILSSIIFLAYSNLRDMKTEIAIKQAAQTVNMICEKGDELYSLGDGTKITIEIILPESYISNQSYISGNTINIFVSGSDIDCKSISRFTGHLPSSSGRHVITLYKKDGAVNVS